MHSDYVGTVDFIHKEDLLPQGQVSLLLDLGTVFLDLVLGNDLGSKNSLDVILFPTALALALHLVRVNALLRMVATLVFVLEHRLIDYCLSALSNLFKELILGALKQPAILALRIHYSFFLISIIL